jgi:hypothetical protein
VGPRLGALFWNLRLLGPPTGSNQVGLVWGPWVCISIKFLGDAGVGALGALGTIL